MFIELRKLNDDEDLDLEEKIADFMAEHGFPLGREFAVQSLREGLLVVLLDGFDEVSASKRRVVEREIRRIGTKSASQVVVSSRQDSHLDGWDNFSTVAIAPLELNEACELIEKIPFAGEENIKERFVARLRSGLFESHRYFLSNPLLLSIMLLTYGDSADIPTKFSSFYEQAFSALYQKHDALKSGYKRDRKVSLDILDFGRLLSAFSAITYGKKVARFSLQDGIGYVDSAKRIAGLSSVSSEGFLEDSRQAVCILIEDGLDYAFVHRSFQEYFTARFISEAGEETQSAYISRLVKASAFFQGDNVIQLLYEMNPAIVEEKYLIPEMRRLFGPLLKKRLTKDGWKKLYAKVISEIRFGEQGISFQLKSSVQWNAILFIRKNCMKNLAKEKTGDGGALAKALTLALPGLQSISPKDLSLRSPLWEAIQEDTFDLSPAALENLRVSVTALEGRLKERSEAAHEVFDFSGLTK